MGEDGGDDGKEGEGGGYDWQGGGEEGTVQVESEKQKVKVKPMKHNCSNNQTKMIHTSTPFEQSKCIPKIMMEFPVCEE